MTTTAGGDAETATRMVHPMADIEPVPTTPTAAPATQPAVATTANWSPTAAPDGAAIAFVSDRSGEPRLWLRPTRRAPATMPGIDHHPVTAVSWSRDGSWLAYMVAPDGAARTEVWVLRPDGSDQRQVAGFGERSATYGAWTHGRISWLPVAESGDQWSPGHAYLLDPATGRRTKVAEGSLLHALDATPDRRWVLVRRGRRTARWIDLIDMRSGQARTPIPNTLPGSTDVAHFADDARTILLRTDVGHDLAVLAATPTTGGEVRVVAARDDAEVETFAVSGDGRIAVLLWNTYGGRTELSVLDMATETQRQLDAPADGDVLSWCELSTDGQRLLATAQAASQPRNIWAVDTTAGTAQPVTYGPPQVVPARRLAPELHRFAAEDGLGLSGWLYRANGDRPGPVLLYFHGGPEAQERPVFNPLYRELVARGLTVFAPNIRGSSGFGRRFVNADNLDKRHAAITDVRAAVSYLTAAGIAQPGRIGCMGRSYGGYLTLVALTRYPDLFAIGVDVCGMVDLETFYEHTEPWIAAAAISKYGDPERDRGLLRELSPIHRIDELRAPLLVVHGAHDTNVPLYEAEQVVAALEARRVPCDFLLFRDEGHVIRSTANRAYFVRAVADWLTEHLDDS